MLFAKSPWRLAAVAEQQQRSTARHARVHAPFVDRVKALVSSGRGGDGASKFSHIANNEFAGPSGANGGKGGSIFAQCSRRFRDLAHINALGSNITADRGDPGGAENRRGKNGRDLFLELPPGTVITDVDTNQVIVDLDNEQSPMMLLLEGGRGGRGNRSFSNMIIHSPLDATRGLPGNAMLAQFELKMIADVGLVGFPNAGKSSLLGAISSAQPQVAAYPFTTLHPTVGRLQNMEGYTCQVADLPGLIEGAYENRGLGHQFLRHVERTTFLALVVDMVESYIAPDRQTPPQPWEVVATLMDELEFFLPGLSERVTLIFANKMDIQVDPSGTRTADKFEELQRRVDGIPVFPVSAAVARASPARMRDPESGLLEPVEALCKAVFDKKKADKAAREAAREQDLEALDRQFRERHPQYFAKEGDTAASKFRVHYVTKAERSTDLRYARSDRVLSKTELMLQRRQEKAAAKTAKGGSAYLHEDLAAADADLTAADGPLSLEHRSLVDQQLESFEGDSGLGRHRDPYLDLPDAAKLKHSRDVTTGVFKHLELPRPARGTP